MTRRAALLLLLGGLLLAGCGGESGGNWETFDASEGGFRVTLPGRPVRGQEVLTTPAGPLESITYTYATPDGQVSYGINYADYPAAVARSTDPERIIESARDALVGKLRGRVRDERRITLDGAPGREVDIELADGRYVRARIYLAGQRQYQVVAVTPSARDHANDAKWFLESFKLLR